MPSLHVSEESIIKSLGKRFPRLLNENVVNKLIDSNSISYESAIELKMIARESDENKDKIEKLEEQEAMTRSIIDFKREAVLSILKEDNRYVYDEFAKLNKAYIEALDTIAAKYEDRVNMFLGTLKANVSDDDKKILDKVIKTKLLSNALNFEN